MTEVSPDSIEFIPANYFEELTPSDLFTDPSRPLELDVGCGDGTFLLEMARHFPTRNFLGIERLGGRIRKICRKAARMGLQNVRVLHLESSYALSWLLPLRCASRLHLLFPDPWPKKRHAFHRFVHPGNLAGIHRVLAPEGTFHFKTDHGDYFVEATAIVDASNLFTRIPWDQTSGFYPTTDFEEQWLQDGKTIGKACWRRLEPPPEIDRPPGGF